MCYNDIVKMYIESILEWWHNSNENILKRNWLGIYSIFWSCYNGTMKIVYSAYGSLSRWWSGFFFIIERKTKNYILYCFFEELIALAIKLLFCFKTNVFKKFWKKFAIFAFSCTLLMWKEKNLKLFWKKWAKRGWSRVLLIVRGIFDENTIKCKFLKKFLKNIPFLPLIALY